MAGRLSYRSFAASGTLFPGPGGVLGLVTGWQVSGVDLYFQLFDASAPNNGDTPFQCIFVPNGSNFSFAPSSQSPPYGTACTWRWSTTGPTLTLAGSSGWVYAEGFQA